MSSFGVNPPPAAYDLLTIPPSGAPARAAVEGSKDPSVATAAASIKRRRSRNISLGVISDDLTSEDFLNLISISILPQMTVQTVCFNLEHYPTKLNHLRCALARRSARRAAKSDAKASVERCNEAGVRQGAPRRDRK